MHVNLILQNPYHWMTLHYACTKITLNAVVYVCVRECMFNSKYQWSIKFTETQFVKFWNGIRKILRLKPHHHHKISCCISNKYVIKINIISVNYLCLITITVQYSLFAKLNWLHSSLLTVTVLVNWQYWLCWKLWTSRKLLALWQVNSRTLGTKSVYGSFNPLQENQHFCLCH